MELQCCGEFEAGSSKCKNKNLTVQKYLHFCESHNHSDLTVPQLKKVISIHGFKITLPKVGKEVLIEAVDSIELMDLTRSTINDDNVTSYAFITSGEAIKDLMCLNWIECSVTSFKTFNAVNYDLISLQNANDVALKSKTTKKKQPKVSKLKDEIERACSLASGDQCSAKGNTGDPACSLASGDQCSAKGNTGDPACSLASGDQCSAKGNTGDPTCSLASGDQCPAKGNTGDCAAAEFLTSSSLLTMKQKLLKLRRFQDIVEQPCSLASGDQCSAKGNISDSVAAEYNSSSSLLPEAGEEQPRRKRQASTHLEGYIRF